MYDECMTKQRLSASVDSRLLAAGRDAVASGIAPNLSAWVNEALRRQADHDQRMRSMGDFIAAYEAEHGVISDQDMLNAERWSADRTVVVDGRRR
jgi:hypothetical protein